MRLDEFRQFVEEHSEVGAVLEFKDKERPLSFRTSPGEFFRWEPLIGSSVGKVGVTAVSEVPANT